MRRAILGVVATAACLAAVWLPTALAACSIAAPEPLATLLEQRQLHSRQVVGFYEQRHIAWSPPIPGLATEYSASYVVRYWGQPPSLSIESHGQMDGILGGSSCYFPGQSVGHTSFGVTLSGAGDHSRGLDGLVEFADGTRTSPSDAELAAIADVFGPLVERSPAAADYVLAYGLVWWRPIFGLGAVAAVFAAVRRRLRFASRTRPAQIDPVMIGLAFAGATAIALVIESLGALDWLGLLAATVVSVGLGNIFRSAWAAFAGGLLLWLLANGNLTAELNSGDGRTQSAAALLIVAVGALSFSRRHWTNWLAGAALVIGSIFFVVGALEIRGYRDPLPVWGAAALVGAAAAGVLAWRASKYPTEAG